MIKKAFHTNGKFLPKSTAEWLSAVIDMLLLLATYALSVFVSQYRILGEAAVPLLKSLPIVLVLGFAVFFLLRIFKVIWRYAGVREYLRLAVGCALTTLLYSVTDAFLLQFLDATYAFSTYVSFTFFSIVVLMVSRLVYTVVYAYLHDQEEARPTAKKKRTMIIGAGFAANSILEELRKNSSSIEPICLIDDDRKKLGRTICDVLVVGNTYEIVPVASLYQIDLIIFAIPSANELTRKNILERCIQTGCEIRVLPYVGELIYNANMMAQTKEINVNDLLGRAPVTFDDKSVSDFIRGKKVMVTGGGGSIGSELCRQAVRFHAAEIILMDIYENTAYEIQQEILRKHPGFPLHVEIATMTDRDKMEELLSHYRPDIIFHAAAHKHVPLMETNPEEAVKNNVFGTFNMVQLADQYHVGKFIMISTDKAVNPTNVMGATKRLCEMIVRYQSERTGGTEFASVRFGNVLGSHGSVIPLFREQILAGGPVTVTHRDIVRYFMTIPEAVTLVLQAGAFARGGEVFVLDMGEPVRILNLAENLIRMLGKQPYTEIPIEFTGLRPGEKLYEELLMKEEGLKRTDNQKIFIGKQIAVDPDTFEEHLHELRAVSLTNDKSKIVRSLARMVETYHPDPRLFENEETEKISEPESSDVLQGSSRREEEER